MNLSEMKRVLQQENLRLTKSLGQNFLHDANVLRKIVELGQVRPGDKILEIGPGLGPLTELLLAAGADVLAIEMDHRLAAFLKKRFADQPHLTLIEGDALRRLELREDWRDWKLVSNLPYSVASPIMVECALNERGPARLVITLQSEVAHRIAATTGDDAYGVLSLLMQWRYVPEGMFKIAGSCFFPPPDVESSTIALQRRPTTLLPEDRSRSFVKIVKRAFSQRRKMMFKLLKGDWPIADLEAAFASLNISPQIRAEAVSLEDFVRLTEALASRCPAK